MRQFVTVNHSAPGRNMRQNVTTLSKAPSVLKQDTNC